MSLDSLLEDYRARDIVPDRPSENVPKRAKSVFDLSLKSGISTDEADSQILVNDILNSNKQFDTSPQYQGVDGLLDIFDPSEAPTVKGDAPADPMGELLKLETKAAATVTKGFLKTMGFVFSPIGRAFKFGTNALMFDPLTKSAAGPTKKAALSVAIHFEKLHQINLYRQANDILPSRSIPKEEVDRINDEVDKQAVELVRQTNSEVEELEPVTAGDFGNSIKDALKSIVPVPGFADDVKTAGEIGAESFTRITGRDAPWYYAPVSDVALETVAMAGLLKIAAASEAGMKVKDAAQIARAARLTKKEMQAIKKLHKAASQAKNVPVASNTVPSANDAATASQKLVRLIKEAKPLRKEKALLLHRDRGRKASKLATVQKNVQGQQLVKSTKGALKGKSPIPDFDPINANMSPAEIDTLFNLINTSAIPQGFDKGRAFLSLDKLLSGQLITKSETANLETVFGRELTKALFGKRSVASIIQDVSFEVINLPRAILASFDLSAAGRQGIIFSVSHPVASMKAFGRSVRAAGSLKYTDDIERVTRNSKMGKLAEEFGVHVSPVGFSGKIAAKEEVYMSNIAEKIPGVAQSERAFTTFLNQQRREVFAVQAQKWIKRGITPETDPKTFQQYATFVNHATGRGSLEQLQPGILTALNATFFSPRLQVSRVQVVGDLVSPATTANARKVIARDLSEFYATGLGIMAMAEMAGAEVERDPQSSDFGKIKVGNTRYNYWGPFQPLATLVGRTVTGKIKSTATGKIKDKGRLRIAGAFLRTKLAPVPGKAFDAVVGETMLGDPVELTGEFIGKTAFESLVPLFIQDVKDAWEFQGKDAQLPISAGLAFTGIGVQTWEVAPFAELELAKDSLARQTYGKNYSDLSFSEVQVLDRDILVNHPGIVDLEREAKFESDGVNFLKRQAIEMRKSEQRLNKKVNKDLLADLDEIKLRLGGVDRTFGNWRLNDEQYKEYQVKVADNINQLFAEMKPLWDTKEREGKYELMSTLLRSAKQLAAQEMKIGDME